MPQSQALAFAIVVEVVAFVLAYLVAGRWAAVASLIAGPLILGPISVQIVRRLDNTAPSGVSDRSRHRARLVISGVFVAAGALGAVGFNILAHGNAVWAYLGIVAVGGLWALVAAAVMRATNGS